MTTESPVPHDAPVMVAWTAYKQTEEYANTLRWVNTEHSKGSLWAAFEQGFRAAKDAGICPHLRAHQPAEPGLCITGLMADDKPHVEPVHVFSEANARLIAAAPDFAAAAASLIEAWDARTTGAQQIITGKSDADLQKQAMAAIDGLRAALTKAGAPQ